MDFKATGQQGKQWVHLIGLPSRDLIGLTTSGFQEQTRNRVNFSHVVPSFEKFKEYIYLGDLKRLHLKKSFSLHPSKYTDWHPKRQKHPKCRSLHRHGLKYGLAINLRLQYSAHDAFSGRQFTPDASRCLHWLHLCIHCCRSFFFSNFPLQPLQQESMLGQFLRGHTDGKTWPHHETVGTICSF